MFTTIERLLDLVELKLSDFFNMIAVIALLLALVLGASNIVFRLLGNPIQGTVELTGFIISVVISLSIMKAQRQKKHIAVGLISQSFSKPVKKVLYFAIHASCGVFYCFCGTALWDVYSFFKDMEMVSETIGLIYYPFVLVTSIACFLMIISHLREIISKVFLD